MRLILSIPVRKLHTVCTSFFCGSAPCMSVRHAHIYHACKTRPTYPLSIYLPTFIYLPACLSACTHARMPICINLTRGCTHANTLACKHVFWSTGRVMDVGRYTAIHVCEPASMHLYRSMLLVQRYTYSKPTGQQSISSVAALQARASSFKPDLRTLRNKEEV